MPINDDPVEHICQHICCHIPCFSNWSPPLIGLFKFNSDISFFLCNYPVEIGDLFLDSVDSILTYLAKAAAFALFSVHAEQVFHFLEFSLILFCLKLTVPMSLIYYLGTYISLIVLKFLAYCLGHYKILL